MELTNISCLITGSTGMLGKAITLALARAGADCICHYHTRADVAGELAGQVVRLARKAMVLQADLHRPEQIDELFEKVADFGSLRILVNSAAVFSRKNLSDITPQSIHDILDMNLAAPLLVSRAFIKKSVGQNGSVAKFAQPRAKIINIADIGGLHPWAGYAEYCASKAGLIAMTKSLAKELAPTIMVNAVAPGIISWQGPVDEQQKQISRIPLGRFGTPEEIAEAVVFLARNDYITGQVLQMDGGRNI